MAAFLVHSAKYAAGLSWQPEPAVHQKLLPQAAGPSVSVFGTKLLVSLLEDELII